MTDFEGLLKILRDGGVEFILVGGAAVLVAEGTLHGRATI